mmetsp:Transcript_154625/g.495736  ORF Transcript_154625/g.495736 Transcript_154625/m.495736 type:complete len:448 (+) Transcript_154625:1259-2602(+)
MQPVQQVYRPREARKFHDEQQPHHACGRQQDGPCSDQVDQEPTPRVPHRDGRGLGDNRTVHRQGRAEVEQHVEDPEGIGQVQTQPDRTNLQLAGVAHIDQPQRHQRRRHGGRQDNDDVPAETEPGTRKEQTLRPLDPRQGQPEVRAALGELGFLSLPGALPVRRLIPSPQARVDEVHGLSAVGAQGPQHLLRAHGGVVPHGLRNHAVRRRVRILLLHGFAVLLQGHLWGDMQPSATDAGAGHAASVAVQAQHGIAVGEVRRDAANADGAGPAAEVAAVARPAHALRIPDGRDLGEVRRDAAGADRAYVARPAARPLCVLAVRRAAELRHVEGGRPGAQVGPGAGVEAMKEHPCVARATAYKSKVRRRRGALLLEQRFQSVGQNVAARRPSTGQPCQARFTWSAVCGKDRFVSRVGPVELLGVDTAATCVYSARNTVDGRQLLPCRRR